MIEVQNEQCAKFAAPGARRHGVPQTVGQQAAIGQMRQGIEIGQIANLLLGLDALANILLNQHDRIIETVRAIKCDRGFEITRSANRATTTIYTLDPRGLVAGSDIDEQVDPTEWGNYVRKSQNSLRVLAEETGGLAVVNMNDFDKALKNIDAASSDYYVLGYYSSNPDIMKRRRQLDVKVQRKGLDIFSRKEYVLRAPRPAAPSAAA